MSNLEVGKSRCGTAAPWFHQGPKIFPPSPPSAILHVLTVHVASWSQDVCGSSKHHILKPAPKTERKR